MPTESGAANKQQNIYILLIDLKPLFKIDYQNRKLGCIFFSCSQACAYPMYQSKWNYLP